MPMSRRLIGNGLAKPRAIGLQFFSHRVNHPCAPIWAREAGNWQGPAILFILCAVYDLEATLEVLTFFYLGSELTSLLCTDV